MGGVVGQEHRIQHELITLEHPEPITYQVQRGDIMNDEKQDTATYKVVVNYDEQLSIAKKREAAARQV